MEDWIQLTEEDLERAQRLTQEQPPMSGIIKITLDDELPPQVTPSAEMSSEQLIITDEDLRATLAEPLPAASKSGPVAFRISEDEVTPAGPQLTANTGLSKLEQILFELLNQARSQHLPLLLGSRGLKWHPGLAAVARGHSNDMLKRHYVNHVSPEGITAAQRITAYSISYVACGENIGIVYGETSHTDQAAYDIHNAFMNQPRSLTNHRGNLLNPIWTHVGIGIAYNPQWALVATQNFISAPMS